jgi:hypothetical protein
MGPGYGRDVGREPGPKVAIVSSAEIAATPGQPLSADYWLHRLADVGICRCGEERAVHDADYQFPVGHPYEPAPETWPAFQRRRKAEALEASAAKHEATAARLRREALVLRTADAEEDAGG